MRTYAIEFSYSELKALSYALRSARKLEPDRQEHKTLLSLEMRTTDALNRALAGIGPSS